MNPSIITHHSFSCTYVPFYLVLVFMMTSFISVPKHSQDGLFSFNVQTTHAKKRKTKQQVRRTYRGPFSQGNIQVSIGGGTSSSFGSDYIILGGMVGYFIIDGLAPSLGANFWLGDDPSVQEVSPGLTYYVYQMHDTVPLVPYGGIFFEKTWIGESTNFEGLDVNAYGFRLGALYTSNNLLIGGGIRQTYLMGCEGMVKALYGTCQDLAPEIRFSLTL